MSGELWKVSGNVISYVPTGVLDGASSSSLRILRKLCSGVPTPVHQLKCISATFVF